MQLPVHSTSGEIVGKAEASDVIFGADFNAELLHQAMVYYQANQRQGTSSTLRRGEVSGGGRKPFAQKGTGRARQGSTRSPILRHGGVAFGPHPRSYRKRMPKRMRQAAFRVALSGKVAGERIRVVQGLDAVDAKTKSFTGVLAANGLVKSALVVTRGQQPDIARGVRNIPRVKAVRADLLNVLDLLRYGTLVITPDAVQRAEELWSHTERMRPSTTLEEVAEVA
jgi:large subunit ribosomal protein L4